MKVFKPSTFPKDVGSKDSLYKALMLSSKKENGLSLLVNKDLRLLFSGQEVAPIVAITPASVSNDLVSLTGQARSYSIIPDYYNDFISNGVNNYNVNGSINTEPDSGTFSLALSAFYVYDKNTGKSHVITGSELDAAIAKISGELYSGKGENNSPPYIFPHGFLAANSIETADKARMLPRSNGKYLVPFDTIYVDTYLEKTREITRTCKVAFSQTRGVGSLVAFPMGAVGKTLNIVLRVECKIKESFYYNDSGSVVTTHSPTGKYKYPFKVVFKPIAGEFAGEWPEKIEWVNPSVPPSGQNNGTEYTGEEVLLGGNAQAPVYIEFDVAKEAGEVAASYETGIQIPVPPSRMGLLYIMPAITAHSKDELLPNTTYANGVDEFRLEIDYEISAYLRLNSRFSYLEGAASGGA